MTDFVQELKREKTEEVAGECGVKKVQKPDWTILDDKRREIDNFVTAIGL